MSDSSQQNITHAGSIDKLSNQPKLSVNRRSVRCWCFLIDNCSSKCLSFPTDEFSSLPPYPEASISLREGQTHLCLLFGQVSSPLNLHNKKSTQLKKSWLLDLNMKTTETFNLSGMWLVKICNQFSLMDFTWAQVHTHVNSCIIHRHQVLYQSYWSY